MVCGVEASMKEKYYDIATVTFAKEVARKLVKDALKRQGVKVANVASRDVDQTAIALLLRCPKLLRHADRKVNPVKRRKK